MDEIEIPKEEGLNENDLERLRSLEGRNQVLVYDGDVYVVSVTSDERAIQFHANARKGYFDLIYLKDFSKVVGAKPDLPSVKAFIHGCEFPREEHLTDEMISNALSRIRGVLGHNEKDLK